MPRLSPKSGSATKRFDDETRWSRLAHPTLHAWVEPHQPLRLVEQTGANDDPAPKAMAAYRVLRPEGKTIWLRFVDGRPVSAITIQFLAWCCERLEAEGKAALLLIWDNPSWHSARRYGAGFGRTIARSSRPAKASGSSRVICRSRVRG